MLQLWNIPIKKQQKIDQGMKIIKTGINANVS